MTSRVAGQSKATGTGGLTNVIVPPLPTGWGQAAGQQLGEHGQPGKRATQPGTGSIHALARKELWIAKMPSLSLVSDERYPAKTTETSTDRLASVD